MNRKETANRVYEIGVAEARAKEGIVPAAHSAAMMELIEESESTADTIYFIKAYNHGVADEINRQTRAFFSAEQETGESRDSEEEKEMKKFEVGKSYRNTFTGNVITVTKRTAQFIFYTLTDRDGVDCTNGLVSRSKIRANSNGDEHITTPAKYMYFASDEATAEQTAPEADAVTPDEPETEATPQEAAPETEAAQETGAADEPQTPESATQESETVSAEAGQPAPEDNAAITDAAAKFIFLVEKHNSAMESAHYASLRRDSAVEMDYLNGGDRLYKAIRHSAERLRRAGMEVRLTDGDCPYYHVTGAVVKRDGAIIAAYPSEAAAGKYVVTGQRRRDLARCETREEAEAVKTRIGGFDVIPVEDYTEPETDCDCAAWDFSREEIEELAATVAEDVNDPDPEREWDFDSIGALLAVAGFYGEREDAKMDACKTPEELDTLLTEELREAERICNVKIFTAA